MKSRVFQGPTGTPLAEDRPVTVGAPATPANEHWLLSDERGSVTAVVASTGIVSGQITYDAFGKVTSVVNPAMAGTYFGYTGQQFDVQTGLGYFNARYYDPASGRFLSQDPIGFGGGDANLYRYTGNNPVNYTDPSGTSIFSALLADIAIPVAESLGLDSAIGEALGAILGGPIGIGISLAAIGYSLFGPQGGNSTSAAPSTASGTAADVSPLATSTHFAGPAPSIPMLGGGPIARSLYGLPDNAWDFKLDGTRYSDQNAPLGLSSRSNPNEFLNHYLQDLNTQLGLDGPDQPTVVKTTQLKSFWDYYDESFKNGDQPNIFTRAAVGVIRPFLPSSERGTIQKFSNGQTYINPGGGPTSGGLGVAGASYLGAFGGVARSLGESFVDNVVQEKTGLPIGPSALKPIRSGPSKPVSPGRQLPFADTEHTSGVNNTLDRIQSGGPFPYKQDGITFKNKEGRLPPGDYREYTVETPGAPNRALRRIVVDQNSGKTYYTEDHYESFIQIGPNDR